MRAGPPRAVLTLGSESGLGRAGPGWAGANFHLRRRRPARACPPRLAAALRECAIPAVRRRIAAVGEVVRRMRGEVLVEVKEYEVRHASAGNN